MTNILKIWTNVKYHESALKLLFDRTIDCNLHLSTETSTTRDKGSLDGFDIAFGQPDIEAVKHSPTIRWVHVDSAGYERFDTAEVKESLKSRDIIFTNSSSIYDEPCSQHLAAMMLGLARRLPQALELQRGSRAWQMMELRADSFLLDEQTVLIAGFGAIGQRLVEILAPYRMKIIAVKRRASGDDKLKVVSVDKIEEFLPQADHVINTLPANTTTRGFFDSARFKAMKRGAIFYNIGRGSTVDQEALLSALQSGRLSAAYLDVTTPEPLPPTHPLWSAPNCYITPHTAGGHIGEKERLVRHFLDNLEKFRKGESLVDRII